MTKLKTHKGPIVHITRTGGHPEVQLKPVQRRCALYLRVSTERQTVENQRPELEQIARMRQLTVVQVYEEQESAVKLRPEYDRMMLDAHRGAFDTLIVWALDRFGRSMLGNLEAVKALDERGIALISVREPWLDTTGPHRSLLIGIFSWVAEQERTTLIARTKAGMDRARAEGKQIGRPRVNVIPSVAKALEASGLSQRAIARKLGASQASVSRVLGRAELWTCSKCGPATDGPVCPKCGRPCKRGTAGQADAKGASLREAAKSAKSHPRAPDFRACTRALAGARRSRGSFVARPPSRPA
jgi:DNA invertase Pin-like site-specific DNA recombinase